MIMRMRMRWALPLAVGLALAMSACGPSGQGDAGGATTFKVWWYADETTPQDAAWQQALKDFQAKHPGVKVEFERKQWQQLNDAGALILNSDAVPDVLEYNKGNASAGAVSAKGLLTDLTSEAAKRGWDTSAGSALTVGTYDRRGLMGSGALYGVPSYGEFVSFYYNKNMFAKYGVAVPTTMDELVAAFETFKKAGITPLSESAADYPAQHLLWGLAAAEGGQGWLKDYFALTAPLDTSERSPLTQAARTVADWSTKGYIDKKSTGLDAQGAWDLFRSGKSPMAYTGTWMVGDFSTKIKKFQWGQFLMPGADVHVGSGGNLWVVPTKAANKALAYDFIDLTMDRTHQNQLANAGGIAVNADASEVTDPIGKFENATFASLVSSNGLGLYGDWPVPNFYQVIQSNTQTLIGGTQSPAQFMANLAIAYDQVQSSVG